MGSKSPRTMAASGVYFWIVFCKHTKFLSLSHGIASPESFLYIFTTVCIRRAVSQFVWADDLPGSVIYHIWANPCILQYALSNIRRRYMANNEQCTATFLSLFCVGWFRLMLASIGTVVSCFSCDQSICHLRCLDNCSRDLTSKAARVSRSRYYL